MTRIIMHGYQGKMGSVICELCKKDESCQVVAGVDISPKIISVPFPTYFDIDDCDMPADVIIDFSWATSVPKLLAYAKEKRIPAVVCTTGLTPETLDLIKETSKHVAVLRSANMSLGINLLLSLLKKASVHLADAGFDIEIIEKHHNRKLDAPSGTALLLADAINEASGPDGKYTYVYDRTQALKPRGEKELGIHSVRGGTIVGEHTVIFAGRDETIEFSHSALSKEVFAVGALNAAKFLAGKAPGYYDMQDLME